MKKFFEFQLDETTCCALLYGFIKNHEIIAALEDIIDKKRLKLTADELIRSKNLYIRFELPQQAENLDELKLIYSQIAQAELKRLKETNIKNFGCHHTLKEHLTALKIMAENCKTLAN